MRYLYYDLGQQQRGSRVIAHLRGSAANVVLLDPQSFDRYRFGQPFLYAGGFSMRSPVELQIPRDGHWYLVIDCGGYRLGVRPTEIEILTPDEPVKASDGEPDLVMAR